MSLVHLVNIMNECRQSLLMSSHPVPTSHAYAKFIRRERGASAAGATDSRERGHVRPGKFPWEITNAVRIEEKAAAMQPTTNQDKNGRHGNLSPGRQTDV